MSRARGGVGAKQPLFGVVDITPLSCHEPKYPKALKLNNETKQRKNMNTTKTKTSTRQLIPKLYFIITTVAITSQIFLTSCASAPHRDNSINAILQKENELLEKLKAERSSENLRQAVEQSETLKRAEMHLLISLDEILKANELVTSKLINSNKKEAKNGTNERTHN